MCAYHRASQPLLRGHTTMCSLVKSAPVSAELWNALMVEPCLPKAAAPSVVFAFDTQSLTLCFASE